MMHEVEEMVHALEKVQREDVIGPLTSQNPRLMFDGEASAQNMKVIEPVLDLSPTFRGTASGSKVQSIFRSLFDGDRRCYSRTEFR